MLSKDVMIGNRRGSVSVINACACLLNAGSAPSRWAQERGLRSIVALWSISVAYILSPSSIVVYLARVTHYSHIPGRAERNRDNLSLPLPGSGHNGRAARSWFTNALRGRSYGRACACSPIDTAASDRSPRIKRRLRGKTSLAEIERLERGMSRVPEPPRLRILSRDPADVPISEGSLIPSGSPRSGSIRAHPYTPIGDAVGGSSFEFVPSVTNRAASEVGVNESMETTPIPRSTFSPSILHNPLQT